MGKRPTAVMMQFRTMDRSLLLLLSCCSILQVLAVGNCFSEGSVSIRDSSSSTTSSTAGRVQYCLRPHGSGSLFWALVCNSTFHLNEAHVACRSNNPAHAAYNTLPGAIFSQVDLTYRVKVQCGGFESSMADCNVTEVPSSSCSVFVTAGVACYTGEYPNSVFLFGSARNTEGFVALFDDGWNSLVVAPTHWTDTHADVVCRQVGYGGGVVPSDTSGYRQPTGLPPLQVNYVCPSSARGLGECTNTQQFSASPMLAAVSCMLSGLTDGTLRLSRGSTDGTNQGTLEIVFNGRFGAVCSSGFGSAEADVACRQLGYESGSWETSTVLASRPLYLSGLDCTGRETSLLSCPYTSPVGYPCSSEVGVHVTCSSPEEDEACSRVCQNGGTRNDDTCMCDCADGYSGPDCQICPAAHSIPVVPIVIGCCLGVAVIVCLIILVSIVLVCIFRAKCAKVDSRAKAEMSCTNQ